MREEKIKEMCSALKVEVKLQRPYFSLRPLQPPSKEKSLLRKFISSKEGNLLLWLSSLVNYLGALSLHLCNLNIMFSVLDERRAGHNLVLRGLLS